MTTPTKKGQKFSAARTFLSLNPHIAKRLMNWQKMHGPTLYKALALSGVNWNMSEKVWREDKANHNEAPSMLSVSPTRKENENLIVRVRIVAEAKNVNKVLAGLLEMARTLDWVLVRNGGIRKGIYGNDRLVYLVFRVPEY